MPGAREFPYPPCSNQAAEVLYNAKYRCDARKLGCKLPDGRHGTSGMFMESLFEAGGISGRAPGNRPVNCARRPWADYQRVILALLLSVPIPLVLARMLGSGSLFGRVQSLIVRFAGVRTPPAGAAALDSALRSSRRLRAPAHNQS
jgi:hypothetical protein